MKTFQEDIRPVWKNEFISLYCFLPWYVQYWFLNIDDLYFNRQKLKLIKKLMMNNFFQVRPCKCLPNSWSFKRSSLVASSVDCIYNRISALDFCPSVGYVCLWYHTRFCWRSCRGPIVKFCYLRLVRSLQPYIMVYYENMVGILTLFI